MLWAALVVASLVVVGSKTDDVGSHSFLEPSFQFRLTRPTRPVMAAAAAAAVEPEPARRRYVNGTACPDYGCPFLPQDVHYNTEKFKAALAQLRNLKRRDLSTETGQATADRATSPEPPQVDLAGVGTAEAATLTLIGYKGGRLDDQINQDRAIVVSPYYIDRSSEEEDSPDLRSFRMLPRQLIGVFDGHAPRGELVSEYVRQALPVLLGKNLRESVGKYFASLALAGNQPGASDAPGLRQNQITDQLTAQALIDTFIELDRTAPAALSGGCTATVVLQQGSRVYVANAGDSRSFIVTYRASTQQARVAYISREDKPNLPDERARVEAAGGEVYIPLRGTSRVVYLDSQTGSPAGLGTCVGFQDE
jgi:serine/threonine protein phosphatase PrpC